MGRRGGRGEYRFNKKVEMEVKHMMYDIVRTNQLSMQPYSYTHTYIQNIQLLHENIPHTRRSYLAIGLYTGQE